MATALSRSTSAARKAIVIFIVFAIFTFIAQFIIDAFTTQDVRPTPIPVLTGYKKADTALGQIPKAKISSLILAPGTKASYALNGKLVSFPPVANVYEIIRPREKFGSVTNARQTATSLGFKTQENRITDDVLFWETSGLTRSLQYHKQNQNWKFDISLSKDPAAKLNVALDSSKTFYENASSSLLSSLKLSDDYFKDANHRVDFINIIDGKYKQEFTSDKARYARVAMYKRVEASSLDPSFTPDQKDPNPPTTIYGDVRKINFLSGPANFLLQGKASRASQDIIHLDFQDFEYGNSGVYNTISVETAWLNIQANKGFLIWLRTEDRDPFEDYTPVKIIEFEADVNNVSLVYFEPEEWKTSEISTHFLQPYYMFQGIATVDDGRQAEFAFIVEALSNSSYITTTPTP